MAAKRSRISRLGGVGRRILSSVSDEVSSFLRYPQFSIAFFDFAFGGGSVGKDQLRPSRPTSRASQKRADATAERSLCGPQPTAGAASPDRRAVGGEQEVRRRPGQPPGRGPGLVRLHRHLPLVAGGDHHLRLHRRVLPRPRDRPHPAAVPRDRRTVPARQRQQRAPRQRPRSGHRRGRPALRRPGRHPDRRAGHEPGVERPPARSPRLPAPAAPQLRGPGLHRRGLRHQRLPRRPSPPASAARYGCRWPPSPCSSPSTPGCT